jgi:sulfate adenylyltransferase subunit 1
MKHNSVPSPRGKGFVDEQPFLVSNDIPPSNTLSPNPSPLGRGEHKRPLRFITCGSVDDGKSTLIGRLLYDSKALMIDQIDALMHASKTKSASSKVDDLDLSLATDGLEAEREQGITIDVAYRYFNTPKRKFIIADAPGHEQYTRNMITGASKSDVAVVLIDVTKLDFSTDELILLPQTKRHTAIAALLRLQHIVVAVNKMDAIDFDPLKFNRVVNAFRALANSLNIKSFTAIPVSALRGDGVVAHSARTAWFNGPALLPHLEGLALDTDRESSQPASLAVQWVTRDANDDHLRWATGDVSDASLHVGDSVYVSPSGTNAIIAAIRTGRGDVALAHAGEAVALCFDRQLDVARGDWIIATTKMNVTAAEISDVDTITVKTQNRMHATIAWLDSAPLMPGRRYVLRHGTRWLPARVTSVGERFDLQTALWSRDVSSIENDLPPSTVQANDLIRAEIEFAAPLPVHEFANSATRGAFVLVDPGTNATAAAGVFG